MSAWRSPALARAVEEIERQLAQAWEQLLAELGVEGAPPDEAATPDEAVVARMVVDSPHEHPWRVVDAALDRLRCAECGAALGSGPLACDRCGYYNGLRFAAREIDRPSVVPGNEHAIRVASVVARTRERYSPRARTGYELALPALLDGDLPTTAQAQAAKALINRLTPQECDRVTSMAEVERLARDR